MNTDILNMTKIKPLSEHTVVLSNQLTELFKKSGQDYFDSLVKFIYEKVNPSYCFVGKHDPIKDTIVTQSFYANNSHLDSIEYALKDTPCANVVDKELCVYENNVQRLFPKDEDLKMLNVISYVGMPLFDVSNNPIGIFVVMDDKPLVNCQELITIIESTKSKTELELERILLKEKIDFTNETYQDLFESFQNVFFKIDYSSKNKRENILITPSIKKILGYSVDEIKNISSKSIFNNKKDKEALFQILKSEKKVKNYPLILKHKNGSFVFVEIDGEYLEKNELNGIEFTLRGVLKDVTQMYKEILRSKIAYVIAERSKHRLVNLKSLCSYIHEAISELIAIPNFYIAVKEEEQIFFPYFKDKTLNMFEESFSKPISKDGLTEYIIKSKKVLWCSKKTLKEVIKKEQLKAKGEIPENIIGIPLKSEGISVGAMVVQTYDKNEKFKIEDVELLKFIANQIGVIIDRKQWQEKLVHSEEYYRSLVENSSEIIGVINEEGIIEYMSKVAFNLLGYHPHELIGNKISDFLNLKELSKLIDDKKIKFVKNKSNIVSLLDKKGREKHLEVSISKTNDKKSKSVIINAKDITDRVLAERKKEMTLKRLKTIHLIEKALLSDRSLSEILKDALLVITENIFDVDKASIGLLNYDKKRLEILALKTKYKTIYGVKTNEFIRFDEMTSLKTILEKKPFNVNDINQLKNILESDKNNYRDGVISYYINPIVINNKVIGTLNFGSKTKGFFNEIDEDLLKEITQLVAVVINDAILKKEIIKKKNELVTIFNSSNEGILKIDIKGNILDVNERLCEILGYKEKELKRKNYKDITLKEESKSCDGLLEKISENNLGKITIDKRFLSKKGDIIDCKLTVKPVFDSNKEMDYITAFIEDKTEERKAQKQVTDIKNALNHTALVFFTDLKGIITDANENLAKVSCYSRKEIIGSSVKMFNSKYHSKKWWKQVWETIKQGKTWQGEIKNEKKDGSSFWVFSTITPVLNKKGEIVSFISIQLDITNEKQIRSNLIREVIEAQEQERERFAMEIHDGLGQVLLATKMNLSAMQESSESFSDEMKVILGNSLDLLTEAVQEARSISHGLMSRVLNRFGLAYAISEIVNNVNSTTDIDFVYKHNIKDFRFKEEIEMGLYRTLQELIKNIIKHSRAKKAYLEILREGNEIYLEIRDDGVGIKKQTVDNPQSGGIGLRNMRSRIEYLGGTFNINNKIKIGTQIKINISL